MRYKLFLMAFLLVSLLLIAGCDWALISFFTPEESIDVQVQFNAYLIDRETNQPKSEFLQTLTATKMKGDRKTGSVPAQTIYSDVNGRAIMRFGFNLHPGEHIQMCSIVDAEAVCESITFADADAMGKESVSMIRELRVLV